MRCFIYQSQTCYGNYLPQQTRTQLSCFSGRADLGGWKWSSQAPGTEGGGQDRDGTGTGTGTGAGARRGGTEHMNVHMGSNTRRARHARHARHAHISRWLGHRTPEQPTRHTTRAFMQLRPRSLLRSSIMERARGSLWRVHPGCTPYCYTGWDGSRIPKPLSLAPLIPPPLPTCPFNVAPTAGGLLPSPEQLGCRLVRQCMDR